MLTPGVKYSICSNVFFTEMRKCCTVYVQYLNADVLYMYLNADVLYMYLNAEVLYMYLNADVMYMYLNADVLYMYVPQCGCFVCICTSMRTC